MVRCLQFPGRGGARAAVALLEPRAEVAEATAASGERGGHCLCPPPSEVRPLRHQSCDLWGLGSPGCCPGGGSSVSPLLPASLLASLVAATPCLLDGSDDGGCERGPVHCLPWAGLSLRSGSWSGPVGAVPGTASVGRGQGHLVGPWEVVVTGLAPVGRKPRCLRTLLCPRCSCRAPQKGWVWTPPGRVRLWDLLLWVPPAVPVPQARRAARGPETPVSA